ncbi:hypothetical protein COB52_00620 [Candidatus Kaiserbacteria bacterium]|nr:MAG: hypothetical protein COB52_00620 [Candidatus Kaiserbacteria bacterium]
MLKQKFDRRQLAALDGASTYDELAKVALGQMRMLIVAWGQKLDMVCGPISTGGLGTKELNILRFIETIDTLRSHDYPIFSQIPYEEAIWRIQRQIRTSSGDNSYDYSLLEQFYRPVFSSGLVKRMHFIPGSTMSEGSSWEHGVAMELGIERSYLGNNRLPL